MVQVKICGLSEPDTLATALKCGAAYVGLNFFPPSPRSIDLETARALGQQVNGGSLKVAVTVDADDVLLDAIMDAVAPDLIQAHGDETPERIREIAKRTGARVIKAIGVRTAEDITLADAYDGVADMLLFDAKAPDSFEALPGGNGVSFDWSLLSGRRSERPFMLSGGLDADSIAAALAATGAPILDVSSGVERAPGVKDVRLIAKFIEAADRA